MELADAVGRLGPGGVLQHPIHTAILEFTSDEQRTSQVAPKEDDIPKYASLEEGRRQARVLEGNVFEDHVLNDARNPADARHLGRRIDPRQHSATDNTARFEGVALGRTVVALEQPDGDHLCERVDLGESGTPRIRRPPVELNPVRVVHERNAPALACGSDTNQVGVGKRRDHRFEIENRSSKYIARWTPEHRAGCPPAPSQACLGFGSRQG
jgi:hypothetical protein